MEIRKKPLNDLDKRDPFQDIVLKPIGIVHSSFKNLKGIPIQFSMSKSKGTIEIFKEFKRGLKDLDGFSHLYCIYFFDLVKLPVPLQSKPFLDDEKKGVFSTRTPFRPNPIGLSILEIDKIEKNIIFVNKLDILNKTPIIDIKPYVNEFDSIKSLKSGWLEGNVRKKAS
jgi:tRNA-Thr(GGU) m(6)t(6)A37 methyltransferase TsaA